MVVPLRKALPRGEILTARVTSIDHAAPDAPRRAASREPRTTWPTTILVVALGSIARTLPIPGLAEHAIGFKTVEEAIALRNQVLDRLDIAASVQDPATKRRAHVRLRRRRLRRGRGAGRDRGHGALRDRATTTPSSPADLRFVLVEATNRILPEVGEDLGE